MARVEGRRCDDCRFVGKVEMGRLVCRWEKFHLPPAVFRARLWGVNAPDCHPTMAETCSQFEQAPVAEDVQTES